MRDARTAEGFLPSASPRQIDASTAVFAFTATWVIAQVVSALIARPDSSTNPSFGVAAWSLVGMWFCYLAGLWVTSQRAGSRSPITDYGFSFRWADATGLFVGVVAQLVLVPSVYFPLEAIWPDTFAQDRLTESAQDLVDSAGGSLIFLLFLVVVVGAPVVEELFYRGLLQRPLAARFNEGLVVIGVAALFAGMHFRPVEFPGLFVFGLLLGWSSLRADRLGPAITIHVGFNLTGILLTL